MKNLILILVLLFVASAHGAEKLLDCNIPQGDLQEVAVISEGATLTLWQLDNSGRVSTFALPKREWTAGKIKLRIDWDTAVLVRDGSEWYYRMAYAGLVLSGKADCFRK